MKGGLFNGLFAAVVAACSPAALPEADLDSQLAAEDLIGRTVLIGLSYLDASGAVVRQVQLYGRIETASERSGIVVRLQGERAGETYDLPPDFSRLRPAPPGEYRLRSTGEVVVDPDFLTEWFVEAPKNA